MKKLLTILVLFFVIISVKAETEPNDNSNQSNVLTLNATLDGVLSGSDIDDWYILNIPQGGILSFTVHKTGVGNARIYMLDADRAGFPEITNMYMGYSDSPPEGWTITYPVLPGNYYFHFLRYDPSVVYTITPSLVISNFGQDNEPNHVAADAQVFSSNGTVGGTLRYYRPNDGSDVTDWFKMVVPQGAILNIKIQKKGPGNTWIRMRDAELPGLPEISSYYTGYSDSPAGGWIWSFPMLAGTYYFQVSEGENWLDYQLEATLVPPVYTEDMEPNNTYTQTGNFMANGSVTGTLRYYGAGEGWDLKDLYKMSVPRGGILNLQVHKSGPGNSWIRLRDAELTNYPEISNFYTGYSNSPAGGWNWRFPVSAGDYYFQIEEGENILDYKMESTLLVPIWGEDSEPNDSVKYAQHFPVNDSIGGLMGYYKPGSGYDGWDWFEINTIEYGLLSFAIKKLGLQNGNVRFRNVDTEIGSVYMGFGDQTVMFSKILPAGKYYVGFEKLEGDYQYKIVSNLLPAPVADFTFTLTGNAFAFENKTVHNASYVWKFDDGATATTVNAFHEYNAPGNFNVCLIATNPAGVDTTCKLVSLPGVARVLPNHGGNTGDATLEVFGGGLDTNFVAKIKEGNEIIALSNFTGLGGKSSIFIRFDLRGKKMGNYDLVIEKPGGLSYQVAGGFSIVAGVAADPWVSVNGRSRILFNTWSTYTVNYGNKGNVDAKMAPIWLVFSNEPGLQIEFPNVTFYTPDTLSDESSNEGIYMVTDSVFGEPFPARVYPLLLPVIAAGSEASFNIKVKTSGTLKIKAWAEKPWYQSPINEQKQECIGDALAEAPSELNLSEDKVLCTKFFTAIILERTLDAFEDDLHHGHTTESKRPPFISTLLKILKAASKICGIKSKEDRDKVGDFVAQIIINRFIRNNGSTKLLSLVADDRSPETCSAEFAPQNPTTNTLTAVSSLDPNEKSGATGYGPENYIRGTRNFPYTIDFENKASATAPAHTVTITDQLNIQKFDLSTFSFGNMVIADSVVYLPTGLQNFVVDKKLNKLGVTVRIQGNLNVQTGVVEWLFRSLDASNLAEIEDPDIGFLPPNITSPEGQGSVSFFIQLKSLPKNAEEIRNHAFIVFDANEPILTNEHMITFDLKAPESAVGQLPATTNQNQFEVSWSGQDNESGIQFFHIYVSENGGGDSLWLAKTHKQSEIFTGKYGSSYKFYSIAVDNAGNIEAAPTQPDAEISILVGTDDATAGNGIKVYPNPASDLINFRFINESTGMLTLYRQDGVPVFYKSMEGESDFTYSTAGLSRGVYFWKWLAQDGTTMAIGKIILVDLLN
jgi:PKD repeat protein